MNSPDVAKLTPKDFVSDQEVRWCPGCGDYAILKAVEKILPETGTSRENTVFVSGIGCSSRFPYYLSTYGFHTIHGRAPAIATGVKLANPDLDVWMVTGDGDGLSIGGNHLLHVLRRNVDLQILLFNNEIYGLTKGQYSPTSRAGTRSPSTPDGSFENPINPCAFAIGAGARFVARGVDTLQKDLPGILLAAHAHKGASFVEIFQNCIVYNDNVFGDFTDRDVAADMQLHVKNDEPLLFGKESEKGIRLDPTTLKLDVVILGENDVTIDDILVHDETNKTLANLLIEMAPPEFPMALGVIYNDPEPTYGELMRGQIDKVRKTRPAPDLNALLRSGNNWTVD